MNTHLFFIKYAPSFEELELPAKADYLCSGHTGGYVRNYSLGFHLGIPRLISTT